jgi:hypothetical protein
MKNYCVCRRRRRGECVDEDADVEHLLEYSIWWLEDKVEVFRDRGRDIAG